MREPKIECFMIQHIRISRQIAAELCTTAMDMVLTLQRIRLVDGPDFTGEITTAYVNDFLTLVAYDGQSLIDAYDFTATLTVRGKKGKVCFVIPSETPRHRVVLTIIDQFASTLTDDHGCLPRIARPSSHPPS